jgi:transcriptional regulator with XRE-family HTH domain
MLCDVLKYERQVIGLTQEEVAKRLDITVASYALYEQNRRRPDYDTLILLADMFGCSTDYLLGRVKERNSIAPFSSMANRLIVKAQNAKVSTDELEAYIEARSKTNKKKD